MKVNKNIGVGKNKPYNQNSLYFPNGVNSGGTTPAPPSGGENTYEYIELTKPEGWEVDDFYAVATPLVIMVALLGKVELDGSMTIVTPYMVGVEELMPIAIAYDPNMLVHTGERGFIKVSDVFQIFGIPEFPRLTKEQFYDLNA